MPITANTSTSKAFATIALVVLFFALAYAYWTAEREKAFKSLTRQKQRIQVQLDKAKLAFDEIQVQLSMKIVVHGLLMKQTKKAKWGAGIVLGLCCVGLVIVIGSSQMIYFLGAIGIILATFKRVLNPSAHTLDWIQRIVFRKHPSITKEIYALQAEGQNLQADIIRLQRKVQKVEYALIDLKE